MQADDTDAELNVTPLVDVALVLVIIFMVTAPLLRSPSLPIRLPRTSAEETKDPVQLAITLAADGRIALNDKILREPALLLKVEEALAGEPDALVVIRADRSVQATQVVDLAKKIRGLGAHRIAIGTDRVPTPRRR